ncbi:MAG: polyprenyl synthetase family protein [Candidatus Caldatribacteriota bacterium]
MDELKASLDQLSLKMTEKTSSKLADELNSLVESSGKKFRPGLLYLIGQLFNLEIKDLTPFARAVELTHLASLIHDDVIDGSDTRRNSPTLNALHNNTTSILAGDYVLATIMKELALTYKQDILIDLTVAIQDLADGEWLQYTLKKKDFVTKKELREIAIKKTGSLIRWCLTTPGKLAGFDNIPMLSDIGERIGLIFQMADDIVDSTVTSGKPAFLDILNGQINFVTEKLCLIYPELKERVYQLRRDPQAPIPWTAEQYFHAIQKVDEDINAEKEIILNNLKQICEQKDKVELMPLFELMVYKIQSNYESVLNGPEKN